MLKSSSRAVFFVILSKTISRLFIYVLKTRNVNFFLERVIVITVTKTGIYCKNRMSVVFLPGITKYEIKLDVVGKGFKLSLIGLFPFQFQECNLIIPHQFSECTIMMGVSSKPNRFIK